MRDFFRSLKFKILLIVLALLFGFLLAAAAMGGESLPNRLLGYIVTPIQTLSSRISGAVSDFFNTWWNAGAIQEENQALLEKLNTLREQMVDYEQVKRENEQYKQYLSLKEENPDFTFEPASVVGRSANDAFGSFVINRGSLHDVSLYDPVITDAGLVGYISEVSSTFSRVSTVLDQDLRVGCYNIRTRDTGVLTGSIDLAQQGLCQMMYLSRDSLSAAGDLVVTGGTNGIFPEGLIIGSILQVEPDERGISLNATVRPVVFIQEVDDVFVITSFLGQGSSLESFESGSEEEGELPR